MAKKIIVAVLCFAAGVSAVAQGNVAAATKDPVQVLARAREVMGFDNVGGRIMHERWATAWEQPYQSDRTYPPFFSAMLNGESWIDVAAGVERARSEMTYPGTPVMTTTALSDANHRYVLRDSATVAAAPDENRNLDAWLVIADWSKAQDVVFAGRQTYRDYPRMVLTRKTADGEQRLFIDEKSGFPVKLEYVAPHYLWGQQKIEYVYSVWQQAGPVFTANTSFRVADSEVEVSRTVENVELLAASAAPSFALPDPPQQAVNKTPMFLRPIAPKVVEVSANTKILSNPGYSETITAVNDEVYVLDATQGEERARQDQDMIRKFYPAAKRINVVVTDLAWPHVAGVRYWVANGATIISHRAAQQFLQQVLDRRWTLNPDSYEKSRNTAKFKFVGVDQAREFAGGKVKVFPIDGIASEVALAVYLADDKFLWASDYIQTVSEPTMYAAEVMAAVKREGLQPERVAAEHLPLNDWGKIIAAQEVKTAGASGSQ